MKKVYNKFNELKAKVNEGFLLHGSNKKFDVIKPNLKEFIDPRAGKLKAVYSTDDPLMAMFLAVISPQKLPMINGKRKNMISWGYEDEKINFWVTPNFIKYNAFAKGWVYVADKKLFRRLKKLPHEYHSYKEVLPTEIIEVTPEDLFAITEPQTLSKEAIIEAGFHTEEEIKFMGYE